MALQCQVVLSRTAYQAGQTPPPTGVIVVYNPNASPILITGARLTVRTPSDTSFNQVAAGAPEMPLGPGQTTLVPALSSITIGPFALSANSAANANSFQAVNQTGNIAAANPQPSQLPQQQFIVGAVVYGSDGSINFAGPSGVILSYTSAPPLGYQGGFFNFAAPNNLATAYLVGLF